MVINERDKVCLSQYLILTLLYIEAERAGPLDISKRCFGKSNNPVFEAFHYMQCHASNMRWQTRARKHIKVLDLRLKQED
jgi:hypothetical protein